MAACKGDPLTDRGAQYYVPIASGGNARTGNVLMLIDDVLNRAISVGDLRQSGVLMGNSRIFSEAFMQQLAIVMRGLN